MNTKNVPPADAPPRRTGIPLAEVGVVSLAILILGALAVPAFVKSRRNSAQNACIGNLRFIDSGKEQWALTAKKTDGDPVCTTSVNMYIRGNTTPVCPGGGRYIYNNIGSNPACTGVTVRLHQYAG